MNLNFLFFSFLIVGREQKHCLLWRVTVVMDLNKVKKYVSIIIKHTIFILLKFQVFDSFEHF